MTVAGMGPDPRTPHVMPTRRTILSTALASAAAAALAAPALARTPGRARLEPRGDVPVGERFRKALHEATAAGQPLVLDAGTYTVDGIRIPEGAAIVGRPGLTRLRGETGGPILVADDLRRARLEGIVLDGTTAVDGEGPGVVAARRVADLRMSDCEILGGGVHALALEGCGGRIARSTFGSAAQAGIFALDSTGLSIEANDVRDCRNGGILVWRSAPGEDGTQVIGNRIARIAALGGGTGQNGNGVNVYRAGNVMVAQNVMTDCAFSAIRSNGGSNLQVLGNQCLRSGETAIYAEFAFEGAIVANNLIDRAAHGISITNFNLGGRLATVSGNIVRNLSTRGPYVSDPPGFGCGIFVEADAAVTGNVVENAPLAGMGVGFGPFLRDVVVSANTIRQVGFGILVSVVDGAGPVMLTDNLIRAARRGAIVGFRHAVPATGDLVAGASPEWKHLTISGNRALI